MVTQFDKTLAALIVGVEGGEIMTTVDKALVPLIFLIVFGGGYYFHVIPANVWSEVIALVLSSVGTYFATNKGV